MSLYLGVVRKVEALRDPASVLFDLHAELVHRRRSAALGEVDATEDLEIAQSIERSRRAHLVKRMRFFFRDEIDASALTHSYREALVHIAKANVSPAMGFAKRVLDGASVAEAHRLETEELREKP